MSYPHLFEREEYGPLLRVKRPHLIAPNLPCGWWATCCQPWAMGMTCSLQAWPLKKCSQNLPVCSSPSARQMHRSLASSHQMKGTGLQTVDELSWTVSPTTPSLWGHELGMVTGEICTISGR